MARLRLVSERPRIVELQRDSNPLPGEKPPERITTDSNSNYHANMPPRVVGTQYVSRKRWTRFLLDRSAEADRLIDALKEGPLMPNRWGNGDCLIDLDRIKR